MPLLKIYRMCEELNKYFDQFKKNKSEEDKLYDLRLTELEIKRVLDKIIIEEYMLLRRSEVRAIRKTERKQKEWRSKIWTISARNAEGLYLKKKTITTTESAINVTA